jgi:alkylation response protein AidB-like acyl-CoA dehydrogenase
MTDIASSPAVRVSSGRASSNLLSRRDLEFLLYEWLDVESLIDRPRFAQFSRETFDAVLDLAQDLAEKEFASHLKESDRNEPQLSDDRVSVIPQIGQALTAAAGSGLIGAAMDAEVGGLQLPTIIAAACLAWLQAGNIATSAYIALTTAAANLLTVYGTAEQIARWVRPMVEGRFFGTMCLSEPQAGSSLADITTRAVRQPDGTYRLFGNKMWISAGDHELSENIVHLVIARMPGAPDGVHGISLFIVPKYLIGPSGELAERNDIAVAGLNHKMGYRGTTNTLLNLGEGRHRPGSAPGAIGYLVGDAGRGLRYMFHMMNEARVSVGSGATAIAYTAYLKSLRYAAQRVQGRPIGNKGPDQPPVPIIEHPDVRRMLLAQKSYVEGALALVLYCGRLLDEAKTADQAERRNLATLLLDVLTPVTKSWPSQWCLEANSLAIQVHGGYGYTSDFDVEQHYRDNRLNLIHEGTNSIQALDLLGRKVVQQGGEGFAALLRVISRGVASAQALTGEQSAEWHEFARQLAVAAERVEQVTRTLWSTSDVAVTLANASVYLDAVGHVVLAWVWLEQATAAHGKTGDFYDGKRHAARFFFRHELPKVGPQLDLLGTLDRTLLDMRAGWF